MKNLILLFTVTCLYPNLALAGENVKSSATAAHGMGMHDKDSIKKQSMNEERENLTKRQEQITKEMITIKEDITNLEESIDPQKDKKIRDLDAKLNALMAEGSQTQLKFDRFDKIKKKM